MLVCSGRQREEGRDACWELFSTACNAGEAFGCSWLARQYLMGEGVKADVEMAGALLGRACDGGDAWGCTALGVLYRDGERLARDESRAVELLGRACELGSGTACIASGEMYESGRGVARDEVKAAALYDVACEEGFALGCARLGSLYLWGAWGGGGRRASGRIVREGLRGRRGVGMRDARRAVLAGQWRAAGFWEGDGVVPQRLRRQIAKMRVDW